MIKPELLAILCCPETHQELTVASPEQVARINSQLGKISNRAGEKVLEPIVGGLVRKDGQFLYPIRNDLPNLLIDQAIPLS